MNDEQRDSTLPVFAPDELDALFQQCTQSLPPAASALSLPVPASSSISVACNAKRKRGRPRGSNTRRIVADASLQPFPAVLASRPAARLKRPRFRIDSDDDGDEVEYEHDETLELSNGADVPVCRPMPEYQWAADTSAGVNTQVPSRLGPDGCAREPREYASAVIESVAQLFARVKAHHLQLLSRNEALSDIVQQHIDALAGLVWPQVRTLISVLCSLLHFTRHSAQT